MNTQGNTRNADGRAAMRAGGAMVAAAAAVLVMAGAAAAMKPATAPAPAPAPALAPAPGGGSGQPVPTLDDLLKLPKQNAPAKPAEKPAAKPAEKPMEKPVGGAGGVEGDGGAEKPARDGGAPAEQANPLTEALELMQDASTRLNPAGGGGDADTSLDTQRLQQRAIDKLDQLISQAKKQQKKKQQQKQQQKQDQQQQQDQKQQDGQQPKQEQGKPGEQQQGEQRQDGKATDANGNTLPGGQGGSLNPALDAARASWGNLPARVRDMLLQGSGEKFSTSYQQLTEEYYRKLAEKQREEKR